MGVESPTLEMQSQLSVPKWGTTEPVTALGITSRPLYDTNGRPVKEVVELNMFDVPFDYEHGLADGGRDQYPVNVSAYKEIIKVWPEALGIMSLLRSTIHPYTAKITAGGIIGTLNAANALPAWMAYRADSTTQPGLILPEVSAIAKIERGAVAPYHPTIMQDIVTLKPNLPPDPLTTHDYVHRVFMGGSSGKKFLVGDEYPGLYHPIKACPAPRKKITEFAEVLFDGPAPNMKEMRERLGLSRDDIQRLKVFGNAYKKTAMLITQLEDKNYSGVTPYSAQYHLNALNRKINHALGREDPPILPLEQFLPSLNNSAFRKR